MKKQAGSGLTLYGIFIALIVALATMAGSYNQFQLPPIQEMVQESANLSPAQYVQAFSSPMLPGLFLSLVAGVLIDRFGYRKMIALSLVVSTIGAAGRIFCSSYLPFFISMALTGFAPTFVQSNNAKIMSNYVPKEQISVAMGVVMLGGSAASFLGSSTTHLFPSAKAAYLCATVLGIVALVLWLLCIRQKSGSGEAETTVSVASALKNVLRSAKVWRIAVCMFFVQGFFMSVSSTGPSALKSLGYAPATAGLLTGMLSIGSPLGCLIGAPLAIRSGKPKQCMLAITLVTAILFPLLWTSTNIVVCTFTFFLCGFCFGTDMITIASLPINLPEIGQKYAGTAGGLINTVAMAGGFGLSSYVIAPLANGDFRVQFLLAAAALGLGFLAMFLIPHIELKKQ